MAIDPKDSVFGGAGDPLKNTMSIFNPTDRAAMKDGGQFNEDMTVRDVLGKFGIDVDGPASQLVDFAKTQTKNSTAIGKMQGIAGTPPAGPAAPPTPPATPAPSGGSLDDLMGGM